MLTQMISRGADTTETTQIQTPISTESTLQENSMKLVSIRVSDELITGKAILTRKCLPLVISITLREKWRTQDSTQELRRVGTTQKIHLS